MDDERWDAPENKRPAPQYSEDQRPCCTFQDIADTDDPCDTIAQYWNEYLPGQYCVQHAQQLKAVYEKHWKPVYGDSIFDLINPKFIGNNHHCDGLILYDPVNEADPTDAPVGSIAKVEVMRKRLENGQPLLHPDDNKYGVQSRDEATSYFTGRHLGTNAYVQPLDDAEIERIKKMKKASDEYLADQGRKMRW